MKLKLFLFSIISVLIFSCSVKHDIEYKSKLVNPPVATRQLGSAIFVPNAVIKELKINEGNSIEVIHNDKKLEMRVYDSFDSLRTFGMYRKYADMLNLKYDSATVILRKLSKKESKLKPKPIKHWVENNNGDTTKWRRIAYGAPHGDCDYKTGEIIKVLTDKYGIPSTSAWGCRFSYRGRWYDCNRPLMKLPNPDGGTYRDRVWNDKAMEIYQNYQNMVWKNNNMK
ncbi:MAG: hypothetical protein U9N76_08510, partial [Candidatus Marinimicrobia bacterium]|nr:hypothetical protein [Candidatus Neomarinimicrobiota bacterium]